MQGVCAPLTIQNFKNIIENVRIISEISKNAHST